MERNKPNAFELRPRFLPMLQNRQNDNAVCVWGKCSAHDTTNHKTTYSPTLIFSCTKSRLGCLCTYTNKTTCSYLQTYQKSSFVSKQMAKRAKNYNPENGLNKRNAKFKPHNKNLPQIGYRSFVQHRLKSKSRSSTSFKPYMLAARCLFNYFPDSYCRWLVIFVFVLFLF